MKTLQHKTISRAAIVQKPAAPKGVQRKAVAAKGLVQLQSSIKVSSPTDPAEKEADTTAKKIMRMSAPASSGSMHMGSGMEQKIQPKLRSPYISRFANSGIFTQRQPEHPIYRQAEGGQPTVTSNMAADIQNSTAAGSPLPPSVRSFMEPRFQADFSNVKIHTGDNSAKLNRQLNAQAFTTSNQIFFGKDKFQPESEDGKELIAHELTHTIQQGAAIQRSEDVTVTQRSQPTIQRLGLSDALGYFADKANLIPGFRMFTIILGVNPINMSAVDRSAANILRAIVEFLPGGGLITKALDNYGVFEKVGNWVEQQIKTLGLVGSSIKQAISAFLDSLSWRDIFDLGGVWNRAKRIFTEPIDRIISFGKGLITGIIKFVKDAILKPLAALAQGTKGYDLLKAILGSDPITGEPVPRTADNLIGGFMKLIGQEEVWENIKKGNAIARAWAWFQGALAGLMGFVNTVPRKIIDTITSLTIEDIVTIASAFTKVVGTFVNIATDFINWGLKQVIALLEILFSVVAPNVIPYIKKAQAAFTTIVKNPVAFVGNLVRAGKLGFQMFADNILQHLKTALIKWIVGPLGDANVYIPQSFSLLEIVKLVLSVVGLSWANIRSKLVKIIPEPVLVALEKTASILVTLVKDGPAAAWEQIKTELSDLKDQMIAQVTEMITTEVVKAAVMKLVSMLNPAGAVVQAILAIYNTVSFFIDKINQIGAVVASFIDSISAIANGQVGDAAKNVESTMANMLTIVIGFLAKFASLGNIPNKVVGIIKKIRSPIDKGLDKIVVWLGNILKKTGGSLMGTASKLFAWWNTKKTFKAEDGNQHKIYFEGEGNNASLMVASTVMAVGSAISAAKSKTTKQSEKDAVSTANGLKKQAEDVIKRLQSTAPGAYDPKDIDLVNNILNQLADQMKILLPLIAPQSATSPSNLSVVVGDLINYNGRYWVITVATSPLVKYKRLLPVIKSSNADGRDIQAFEKDFKAGLISKINDKLTKRQLYLGSTPSKTSNVGKEVQKRMIAMNKFNVTSNQFLNSRNGKWYSFSQADMGHIIDASSWWNSNGRFKGPQSPEVFQFMKDPDNYEFEESGQNSSRGASAPNYLPPAT
ncbi:DUF4157 domain-containing protein [Chamaesiphon sp. VAR_48_metabat_135_sub]|uniref:eCIS core domain-containing protein n=1 Tax=Chamaesiphon sp. VAR_48_metabat_135_sub TaxID=2964699 RepID=UPI002869EFE8|nr:DUF4157 domain-containing protein [Chamaesiphon sp. VAR_48_metabat_135_sub]